MGAYAEMIFVAGPQRGQRSTLVGKVLLAGRASECDIQLTEEFASRKHLQLELTADGWVLENLSNNPIWINGKKFKTGKPVILDTGDVVRVAFKTELLYVARGDDAEAALAGWKQANPQAAGEEELTLASPAPAGKGERPLPVAPVVSVEGRSAPAAPAPAPGAGKRPVSVEAKDAAKVDPKTGEPVKELSAEEQEAARKKIKTRRYIIFGCIWSVLMVGLVIAIKLRPPQGDERVYGPLVVQREKIQDIIEEPFPLRAAAPQVAMKHEEDAMALYRNRRDQPGNLYHCVKKFKLSLAFNNNVPPSAAVATAFATAKKELIEEVQKRYENAYVFFQDKNWRRAKEEFDALLRVYPVKDEPYPEARNDIWESIIRHLEIAGNQMARTRRR